MLKAVVGFILYTILMFGLATTLASVYYWEWISIAEFFKYVIPRIEPEDRVFLFTIYLAFMFQIPNIVKCSFLLINKKPLKS